MTLEALLWVAAIVAIHTLGLFMGFITASNKERANTMQYMSMALELIVEKAREINVDLWQELDARSCRQSLQ